MTHIDLHPPWGSDWESNPNKFGMVGKLISIQIDVIIFKKSVFAVDLAQDSEEVHRVDIIMVAQPVKPIPRNSIWSL